MKTFMNNFGSFLMPVIYFALGVAWLACAGGASLWLYPISITMIGVGTVGIQAAVAVRQQDRRISSLEARLATLSQGPGQKGP